MAQDLYSVLGVAKDADPDTIKKAFRKLAAKYHPDKNPGKANEDRFKEVNRANEVLSDAQKRANYDEFGDASLQQNFDAEHARAMKNFSRQRGGGGGGRGGPGGFQDIFGGGVDFSEFFGGRGQRGRRPAPQEKAPDQEAEVTIDFASALHGTMVTFTRGTGETVSVRIPAGVDDGGKVRVGGQGVQFAGTLQGDLVIKIRVTPHKHFRREGDDLHLELPITIVEAYEGAKVRVPTPTGEVSLKVAPHAQSGQVVRLKGKGVQKKGKEPGDLYVKFLVIMPTEVTPELTRAIELLRDTLPDPRVGISI